MNIPFFHKQESENVIELKKALKEQQDAKRLNPKWLLPLIFALMIVGLLWIVIFYLTASTTSYGWPIPSIGNWNIGVGLAMILAGFVLTTLWK
jgi:amino acid transporter